MKTIEKAIELAIRVHAGQVDKGGDPYILHPLRLMLSLRDETEMITAVLHDVVEDSEVTLEELKALGFPDKAITAVDCLTRRADESYDNFIRRVAGNKTATKVKILDLKDNMDLTRIKQISEKDLDRLIRYHSALQFLLSTPR